MKVKINGVYSPGDIEKERVSLTVLENVNMSNYAIMDHTFKQDGDLSDKGRHSYRFPSKLVSKNDFVVLYTKEKPMGVKDEKVEKDIKHHFLYMGRKSTVWNKNGGDTCTLMEVHDSHIVKVNSH